jgi:3-isopropylmalate/(R)-2-methylmalate dehydratase large subunit
MEERMTVCNMSIEGGARFGYINPDDTTIAHLRGRPYAPQGEAFDRAAAWWKNIATAPGARFDDVTSIDGSAIGPVVTWGINPGQSVGVGERIPSPETAPEDERVTYREALAFMGFEAGRPIAGTKIDVIIGSCTNSRLSDLRVAGGGAPGQGRQGVRALVVPRIAGGGGRRSARAPRSSRPRAFSGARPGARCASA